jgi:HK97 gp10 family phage protein
MAEVRGVEATVRALRALGPEAQERITDALDKGAAEVEARAKAIAPVDDGDLREAIEVRDGSAGGAVQGAFTAFRAALGAAAPQLVRRIGIFPDLNGGKAFYARWVEFGTAEQPARPFLRPAYLTLRKRVEGRIKRAINAGIKEVARRGR